MKNNIFFKGVFYTVLASLFWGIPQPLFFNQIKFIPAIEIAMHRGAWSFIFLVSIIIYFGRIKEFLFIFKSKKNLLILSITAILITINWTSFIFSVSINRLQDASMGYFMTPIISIILGYLFLNEKISKLKLISICIMCFSILFLIISLKIFPILAFIIAISWGLYGMLRKKIDVASEIGLLYESGFITLFSAPFLIYLIINGSGYFLNGSNLNTLLLMLTGAITIFPLFFFNKGVRFIPLGFAGVIFFLAPSFHFLTSVFILNEDITIYKFISFIMIWIAVIIFVFDIMKNDKSLNESNTQLPN